METWAAMQDEKEMKNALITEAKLGLVSRKSPLTLNL